MDSFSRFSKLAFRVDAEVAHRAAIAALRVGQSTERMLARQRRRWGEQVPDLPVEIFGHKLKNPVGLAAGCDKDALAIRSFAAMGFGFIEAGTVTPMPQRGNPGKRVFRIVEDQAVINRLGFNSRGLKSFQRRMKQLHNSPKSFMLGINIGKNTTTDLEHASGDYEVGLEGVYDFADYVALNISSPNSPGLRDLQSENYLDELLAKVIARRDELADRRHGKVVPVAIKLSPDLTYREIGHIADIVKHRKIDAIIATNTTKRRSGNTGHHPNYQQTGGMSGPPLAGLSTEVIRSIARATDHAIPIIGAGGIASARDAWDKLVAGATAVQLYTSLIYKGPAVIREIVSGLASFGEQYSQNNFEEALSAARLHRR